MDPSDKLKQKYGTESGFKVPEGYFESLQSRIGASLPEYPEAPRIVRLSPWNRVKPYVYLAAMFAGIWLMMRVFHGVTSSETLSLENPPAELVHLMEANNIPEYEDYYYSQEEPEFILEDEVINNYDSFEDFQKDFGYSLKPEYSTVKYINTTDA